MGVGITLKFFYIHPNYKSTIIPMIISRLKDRLLTTCIMLLLLNVSLYAQTPTSLPRSIPEAEGVSSAGIDSPVDLRRISYARSSYSL